MDSNCINRILSEDYYDFITDYELASDEVLLYSDTCYIRIDALHSSLYMPVELYASDGLNKYGYKVYVRLFGLLDLAGIEATGIEKLRAVPHLNLRGNGVLIGIVDTGIDYTHSTFINADGSTKIASIWDQTIQSGLHPEGMLYGTEFSREQINEALTNSNPLDIVPSTDEIGHGTSIAGIIAGNENFSENFSGIVPDAEILVVKLKPAKHNLRNLYAIPEDSICYQENDIMLGIKYLYETASKLRRPISICIGLGTSQGSHDGLSALDAYISSIVQTAGVAVTVAAGNEGNSKHHYEGIMNSETVSETVELNVGADEHGFIMEIWGDPPNTFSIQAITPGGEYVPLIIPRLNEVNDIRFIFENTILSIFFQIVGSRSGAQLVIVRLRNPSEGIWKFIIQKVNRTLGLKFNIWLPINEFISGGTFFIKSSPFTTLTSPANVILPLVVTAYNISNNSFYINSSRGYTRTRQIVPDLAAPGVNIICPIPHNRYAIKSGTSIAAAYGAGISAFLLEWSHLKGNPEYLDGVDIKNLLIRGAERDSGKEYPNQEFGYGKINLWGTFNILTGNS